MIAETNSTALQTYTQELALFPEFASAGEIPADLLARAAQIGADGTGYDTLRAPATTGAFSFKEAELQFESYSDPNATSIFMLQSSALSAMGDRLPSIVNQQEQLAALQSSELLGNAMENAKMSDLTGCIMRPGTWRSHKGYPKLSLVAAKELGLRGESEAHRMVFFVRQAELTGEVPTEEEKAMQVDHVCRNPACCSFSHLRLLAKEVNNSLKDVAAKIEDKVIACQQMHAADILEKNPWLGETISPEDQDVPSRVISTRVGPYALRWADPDQAIIYAEKLSCTVYESLKPVAKKTYERPSRRKPLKKIENQRSMFVHNKYSRKNHPRTTKALYKVAEKGFLAV